MRLRQRRAAGTPAPEVPRLGDLARRFCPPCPACCGSSSVAKEPAITRVRTRRPAMAHATGSMQHVTVKLVPNDKGNPPGKLADAELHFTDGALAGLKLIGFAIWERKSGARTVTFPARQYAVNGERRSFALLRPIVDTNAQNLVRDLILLAYAAQDAG